MKKTISIVVLLFVVTTMICTLPAVTFAADSTTGPWVADFSAGISGTGQKLSHNGCYLNMQSSGSDWTYDAEGDFACTNAREAHLYVGDKYAEDYTIGFKLFTPESGTTNVMEKLDTLTDESTVNKDMSAVVKPETPSYTKEIVLWPSGNRNSLFSYNGSKGEFTFINSVETDAGQEVTSLIKNVPAGSWCDLKFEIDFSDDESSDILFTTKSYLNNEYVSSIEIPKELVTYYYKSTADGGNDYYYSQIVAPDVFQIKTGATAKVKDMYMHPGITTESIVPETVTDSFRLINTEYADVDFEGVTSDRETAGKDTWSKAKFSLNSMGADWKVADGYSTMSFTSGTHTLTTKTGGYEYPRYMVGSAQPVEGKFIWRGKFRADDFMVKKYVIQFNAGNWLSSMLQIDKAVDETVTDNGDGTQTTTYVSKDTSLLKLVNKSTVVDSCEISADKWYDVEVIGTRNAETSRMAYEVTVKDVSTGDVVIKNAIAEDLQAAATSDGVRWQIRSGDGNELMSLPSGTTSSYSVDDIYYASYYTLNEMTVTDISMIQGDELLTASYSTESAIKINALVSNYLDSAKAACLVVAEYDSLGALLNVTWADKEIASATLTETTSTPYTDVLYINFTPSEGSSKIKLFMVDAMDSIKPVSRTVTVNSKQTEAN